MSNWINWRIAIIRHRDLSSGAKGMGLYLNTYMNDRQDMAFPSIATICGEMNMSNKTAIKYLSELEDQGMLKRQKRYGRSVIYHAVISPAESAKVVEELSSSVNPPLLEEIHHSSVNSTLSVVETLHTNKQENKQTNKQKRRFTPPSVPEVQNYCLERGNQIDAEEFVDHYAANGWMRGKSKIKDWKACVRTWEKSARKKPQAGNNGTSGFQSCRTPDQLMAAIQSAGLGLPPAGMGMEEAKVWAQRKMARSH